MMARKVMSGASGAQLLLDQFPGALFAYSFRKLKLSATLSCRVRRSSDNAEQDIGFTGNDLDESALTTFTGANDGFVTIMYDQSGSGNNGVQATAIQQFRIVNAGTVEKQGGFPYMKGVIDSLGYDSGAGSSSSSAAFSGLNTLPRAGSGAFQCRIISSFNGTGPINNEYLFDVVDNSGTSFVRLFDGAVIASSTPGGHTTGLHLMSATRVAGALEVYEDNVNIASQTGASGVGVNTLHAGEDVGALALEQPSFMAEAIYYNSDQNANRSSIETAINSYYGVF